MLESFIEVRVSNSQNDTGRSMSLAGKLLKLTVVYCEVGSVVVSVSEGEGEVS